MVRVLHLLSHTPTYEAERQSAVLVRGLGAEFVFTKRTIGRGDDYRNRLFAFLSLRKQLARDFDLVHVWDPIDLAIVTLAGAGGTLFSPPQFDRRTFLRLQRGLVACRVGVLAHRPPIRDGSVMVGEYTHPTKTVSRALAHFSCESFRRQQAEINSGISPEHCHVIAPGVDCSKVTPGRDPALRAALGFDEHDVVFVVPGESTRAAGHRDALWAVSILHVLHPNWKILLWGRGEQLESCSHLAQKLFQPNLLTVAERKLGRRVEFEELLPAADAAIVTPVGPVPYFPPATCMAAGLPIIATQSRWTSELLKDGHNAALVSKHSPRMLAQRAIEVLKDPQLASQIGSAARADAVKQFSTDQFLNGYRSLYCAILEGDAKSSLAAV